MLRRMDREYKLSESRNAEIRFRWQRLCLRVGEGADWIVPHVVAFLKEQGRMKFVRPLFRELRATTIPGAEEAATTNGETKVKGVLKRVEERESPAERFLVPMPVL